MSKMDKDVFAVKLEPLTLRLLRLREDFEKLDNEKKGGKIYEFLDKIDLISEEFTDEGLLDFIAKFKYDFCMKNGLCHLY